MHIKRIVLEGFKSYGNRVVIDGFDPEFNAITGLNGSGKSNILDSICFLLGIKNLSQVRANSLNELVYKNGQAGINKAVVSITFDNSNPQTGPYGYADFKEIDITRTVISGGKSKYTINGRSVNTNNVTELFHSVQLNIDNPHFLIMQGRITKVLNMKPLEILSMVEEAAGTRMYEDKKRAAITHLERKDCRLKEIDMMLNEHISPQVEKLKRERLDYIEYTKVVREYEQMSKIQIAWDFVQTEEKVKLSGKEKNEMIQKFEDQKQLIETLKKEIEEGDIRIAEIEKQIDTECGSALQKVESELKNKHLLEARAEISIKNKKESLNEEKSKLADLNRTLKDDKATLQQKQKELSNTEKKLDDLQAICDKDSEAIAAAENRFHAVNAGLNEGEEQSLNSQIMAAEQEKASAETEIKRLEMKLKHKNDELKKMESECKKVDKDYNQDQALYKKQEAEINKIKAEINKLNYEDGSFENLSKQEYQKIEENNRLNQEVNDRCSRFPALQFDYVDPVKNFNRNKVRGKVCTLFEVKDPRENVALEITAGGRLYDVIVEDEQVGKQLIDRGQLARRCTMIPLNKIVGHPIHPNLVREAENLVGKNNVATALSRVSFANDLTPAMEYVFGGTFICSSMEVAKKVAFDPRISRKCVTLDGEVFSPAGTLSGGSTGQRGKLLETLIPVRKLKRDMEANQNFINQLHNKVVNLKSVKERFDELRDQCEFKEHEAELLKSRMKNSTFHKQMEQLEQLKEEIANIKVSVDETKKKLTAVIKLIKELKLKDSKTAREDKLKEAEKAVADSKKKAATSQQKFSKLQAEVNTLKMEIEGLNESIPVLEEQIATASQSIEDAAKELKEAEDNIKSVKEDVAASADEVKKQKAILKSHSGEITKKTKDKEAKKKQIASVELQMQQLEHDIKSCGDKSTDASKRLKHLLEKNKWIEAQKGSFGKPKSDFDFTNFDPRVSISRLKELEDAKERLSKNVNQEAQSLLSSLESQFDSLEAKKRQVLRDKDSIQASIEELDDQKQTCLIKACEQVNKDFGSIFSNLLPGATAKLVSQQGKSVLEGLEFKVAFGNVWKESLNELSGGQRSLVALSLILSLLLFNPAPIYILDEVDAALDLSHTANIGGMLKKHFRKSQFIIVSLKDGMFNNANVLFQTKFSDGMSSVSRTCNK